MNIDAAIEKLNEFKKIAKKVSATNLGECELTGFGDDSFTFKVSFKKDAEDKSKIIGFHE